MSTHLSPFACARCNPLNCACLCHKERDVPDVAGPLDGYRPTRPLTPPDYDEYAERYDPR